MLEKFSFCTFLYSFNWKKATPVIRIIRWSTPSTLKTNKKRITWDFESAPLNIFLSVQILFWNSFTFFYINFFLDLALTNITVLITKAKVEGKYSQECYEAQEFSKWNLLASNQLKKMLLGISNVTFTVERS